MIYQPKPLKLRSVVMVTGIFACLGLGGCANYSGIDSDKSILVAESLHSSESLQADIDEWPAQAWWTSFNDAQLSDLVNEALQNSPTLDQAAAKLALANASLDHSKAGVLPSVSFSAEATRQHYSENGIYSTSLGGSTQSIGDVALHASYELDFWGRNRAAVEASRSRQAAAAAEAASAKLLLASSVAKTYFQLAELQSVRHIGEAALQQRQDIYSLTEQRVKAGLDTQVELKQAETQLPLMRANIAQLDENIVNTQHALSALLGAGPDRALNIQAPMPEADSSTEILSFIGIPQNLPVVLLGRRPDLVAARWQVEATQHETDVNKAAFYPNINLVAFAGYSSIGLDQLVRSSSENYGVGPAISLPIFDGGRLRSKLKSSYANYDAAVANYNKTLIDALRDVADQINSTRSLHPQIEQQQLALDSAQIAYGLAKQRYHSGLGNYLTVLNAQTMVLEQQLYHARLVMRALTVRVELSRALGGGFPVAENALATSGVTGLSPEHSTIDKTTVTTSTAVNTEFVYTKHTVGLQHD